MSIFFNQIRQRIGWWLVALLFGLQSFPAQAEIHPLPVEKAFVLSAKLVRENQLVLEWQIAPGYYLYRNALHITPQISSEVQIGSLLLPKGRLRHDSLHGNYQAYENVLKVIVPLKGDHAKMLNLRVDYQGCSSGGFCYAPVRKFLTVNLASLSVPAGLNSYFHTSSDDLSTAENDKVQRFFTGHNLLFITVVFLGLGLLLAFTPCVLPMVPILSGIIVGHRKKTQHTRSFLLSLAYVLGMALTYALAGVFIALVGSSIQAAFQKPWVIILFSALFVVLGLSLLGLYELQLPARFRQRITHLSQRQKGGKYGRVFLMGVLSTLIVSPCVSAPLVGVLAYIGKTGNVLLGAFALFALGLGMGIPLLLIGASADRLLPKAGRFMIVIERMLGILMLGIAILMLVRILPEPVFEKSPFILIHSIQEFQQEVLRAKQTKQPILLDFYADWCASCVAMDHHVFSRKEVQQALIAWKVLRVDVTRNNAFDQAFLKQFQVVGPPTLLFFTVDGKELSTQRIVGEVSAKELLAKLEKSRHAKP